MKYLKLVFPNTSEAAVSNERTAVRAVIARAGKILLLYARHLGVYTLPGGGVEEGENLETALKREALEECGARINRILEKLFIIEEFRPSLESAKESFKITSHYFLCAAEPRLGKQQLTQKEINKGIVPVWTDLGEALETNRKMLQKKDDTSDMPWLTREAFAFQELMELL